MSKEVYIGVNSTARKIKAIFIGVNGVARKVVAGFIGVANVARQFFALSGVSYNSTKYLNSSRYSLAGATVGNGALFGGGFDSDKSAVSTVEYFNSSLGMYNAIDLSVPRGGLAAVTTGNAAVFAGGIRNTDSTVVDIYNSSYTRTTTSLSSARGYLSGGKCSSYAVFGGGSSKSTVIDAYNIYNWTSSTASLLVGRSDLAAAYVGNGDSYLLFGGGYPYTDEVDAINFSLMVSYISPLSTARAALAATTVGDYALFGGGTNSNVVDAYNSSLVKTTPTAMTYSLGAALSATSVNGYALFQGNGYLEIYDSNLTHSATLWPYNGTNYSGAASIGNYAIFAGGQTTNKVDIYNVTA